MKYRLCEIVDITMGQSPKSEFYNTEKKGLPFLQGNRTFGFKYPTFDTYTTVMTKFAKAGDVIMSVRAPVGELNITPVDMCLGRGVCSLRMKNGNQSFLFYMMKYYVSHLIKKENGTVFGSVNRDDINGLEVDIPDDIEEQKKIARFLEMIDDKIELNNEINKNLEQQIQELYKEWFITNREANWQRIPLSDIIFFQEGPGIRNWQYVEDGVKFINIRCINNGLIDTSTANKISLEEASGKYSHFMLEPYDIVMSCSGTLGRYAIVLPQNLPLCLNTSVIRFRPKQYKDDYSFVYGYMTSKEFLNQQITMANGSAQVNFGPTHLKKIEIVEPPVETRKKFNDLVFPLIETQISLRAENTRLVEIRDTLLPCLMSGEIDVSEVEI